MLNTLIKGKLENDFELHNLYVKGEISNWKGYSSGFFFDLIDEKKSVIPCILWRDNYMYLPFEPKDGDGVIVSGSVSVYVARGRYNLSVKTMEKFGQGAALLALEALKKKLSPPSVEIVMLETRPAVITIASVHSSRSTETSFFLMLSIAPGPYFMRGPVHA